MNDTNEYEDVDDQPENATPMSLPHGVIERMEKHAEFESEFLGLFASDSSMESGFDMPPDPNNKKKKGKELAVRKIKYDCNGWKKNPILLE